jgi:hypothetical protein
MAIGINSSSGTGTGYSTGNPQTTEQSSIAGGQENPQAVVGSSSINDQSTGATIPLEPGSVTASSLSPSSTSNAAMGAFIPITVVVIVAIVLCSLIYMSTKSKNPLVNS